MKTVQLLKRALKLVFFGDITRLKKKVFTRFTRFVTFFLIIHCITHERLGLAHSAKKDIQHYCPGHQTLFSVMEN